MIAALCMRLIIKSAVYINTHIYLLSLLYLAVKLTASPLSHNKDVYRPNNIWVEGVTYTSGSWRTNQGLRLQPLLIIVIYFVLRVYFTMTILFIYNRVYVKRVKTNK